MHMALQQMPLGTQCLQVGCCHLLIDLQALFTGHHNGQSTRLLEITQLGALY